MEIEGKPVENEDHKKQTKSCNWNYWLIRGIILVVLIGFVAFLIIKRDMLSDYTTQFLLWLEKNPMTGLISLSCIYIVSTLLFVPGSLLTLGAGVALQASLKNTVYAVLSGAIAVFVGAMVGSTLAMLLGRYLFRDAAKKLAAKYQLIEALEKALESEGLKMIFLLRLCPLIPFNAFNYVIGLTPIRVKDYIVGNFGMVPGTLVFVFIGTTISTIADAVAGNYSQGTPGLILLIVGTLLALAAIFYLSFVVKKYLN